MFHMSLTSNNKLHPFAELGSVRSLLGRPLYRTRFLLYIFLSPSPDLSFRRYGGKNNLKSICLPKYLSELFTSTCNFKFIFNYRQCACQEDFLIIPLKPQEHLSALLIFQRHLMIIKEEKEGTKI